MSRESAMFPQSFVPRYLLPFLVVGLIVALKPLFDLWFGPVPPLILFVPAVTIGAWYGGRGPGLLTTGLSMLACVTLYFSPVGSMIIGLQHERFQTGIFLMDGILTSVLMGELHRARKLSEDNAREARDYLESIRRGEEALRGSEQRFRSLCVCSPVGIYLSDIIGLCTYTNPRCQEMFGFSAEDALGTGWLQFVHPDDRQRVLAEWNQAAGSGKGLSTEYRVLLPEGTIRWVHDCTAPVVSGRGDVTGHVGTVEDITERRRSAEDLRRERDFAEGLIAAAHAAVLVLDHEGHIIRFNPYLQQITGQPSEQVRGEDWFSSFVRTEDRRRAREAFHRARAGAQVSRAVYTIQGNDGTEREIEWAFRSVQRMDGNESDMLAVGHDLTELNAAQRRALQAERLAAIGQMMAGLAHESRNALQRGQACVEMLALRLEGRADALDLLAGIQEAQEDLHHLYEEVRGYASPIILDPQSHRLHAILQETWDRLESARRGKNAQLHECGDPETTLLGDRFRLVQVFRNILDNALAAGDHDVEIRVRWTATVWDGRPAVRVSVQDNGPGLTPEQRRNLFEPFFTTKTHGTGLGMPIVKRIVEAHGGIIEIGTDSASGAEILVTLPRGEP